MTSRRGHVTGADFRAREIDDRVAHRAAAYVRAGTLDIAAVHPRIRDEVARRAAEPPTRPPELPDRPDPRNKKPPRGGGGRPRP